MVFKPDYIDFIINIIATTRKKILILDVMVAQSYYI